MPEYNLEGLGSAEFERLVQSLLKEVIGDGTITFGAGPDGGREATFTGEAPYPSPVERWTGQWIFQAKFHEVSLLGPEKARRQVVADVEAELKKITEKYGHECDNYILITNVPLTPEPNSGTLAKIEKVFARFRAKIPNLHVWGAVEVNRLLEKYTSVRTNYLQFIVAGDVLAQLLARESNRQDELAKTMLTYLATSYSREQNAQLDQAGDVSDDPVRLQEVFFDLAADVSEEQPALQHLSANFQGFTTSAYGGLKVPAVARMILAEAVDRIVLVGGPGEGKSTAGQYIAQVHRAVLLRLPDMSLPDGYFPVTPRLPFRVVLKDFGQWLAAKQEEDPSRGTLDTYLCEHVETVSSRKVSPIDLHGLITSNPTLLILDGLDEVTDPSLRKSLLERISEFIDRCTHAMGANLQILSSTRPIGYSQQFDMRSFLHLRLAKLEHDQVRLYVRKWAVARELDHAKSSRLFESIEECLADSQISLLATTPLQVTILVLIISAGGTPPRQREALFDEYLEVIYKRETGKGHHIIQTEKELLIGLHKYVGYLLHEEATQARATSAVLGATDYEKYVRGYLYHNDPFSPAEQRAAKLRAITKEAGERLVLIVEPVAGEFGFELRSIQEFFAACHLADTATTTEQRYRRFEAIARNAHWRNVALFFAGRVGRSYSGEGSNITEVCRSIDDEGPDVFVRRGSELAIELAVDRALEPNRRGQRSLLQHGLRIFEGDLSQQRRHKIIGLLQKLPREDIRDLLIPLINERASVLAPSKLGSYAEASYRVGAFDLARNILRRMADGDDPVGTLRTLLRLDPGLLDPAKIDELYTNSDVASHVELHRDVLWLQSAQLLRILSTTSYPATKLRQLIGSTIASAHLLMSTDTPIGGYVLPFIRNSWSGSIETDSVAALTVIATLKPSARARWEREESRGKSSPIATSAYRLPPYIEEGKISSVASAEDSLVPLLAPVWVVHLWLGSGSIESLKAFCRYYMIARRHPKTRQFLNSLRWMELSPAAFWIMDAVDNGDDPSSMPLSELLSYVGSDGTNLWLKEVAEVVSRAGIARPGRYSPRSPNQVLKLIRERIPEIFVEYCVVQVMQPSQMQSLNFSLVQKIFDESRLSGPRISVLEYTTQSIHETGLPHGKAISYLRQVLDMSHLDAPVLVRMILPWAMRGEQPIPGELLVRSLETLGMAGEDDGPPFSASAVVIPPHTLKRLMQLAVSGPTIVGNGSRVLIESYAYTWEWYRRNEIGLPKPRFNGFAGLHRTMIRSGERAVRTTGLNLFRVRLPQTREDFLLLEDALLADFTNGDLVAAVANIAIDQEASRGYWIEFFAKTLARGLPGHVAAVFTEAYDRLLSGDEQSLRQLEDSLGLPLQEPL